jgi:hypothetical protein
MITFESSQQKLREKKLLSDEEKQTCLDVLKEMNDTSFFNANNMLKNLKHYKTSGNVAYRKIATVFAKAYMLSVHRNAFAGLSSDLIQDGGEISRKIMLAGDNGAMAMQEAFS